MEQKTSLSEIFLKAFVNELMIISTPKNLPPEETAPEVEPEFQTLPVAQEEKPENMVIQKMIPSQFQTRKPTITSERQLAIVPLTKPTIPGSMVRPISQEQEEMQVSLKPAAEKEDYFPRPERAESALPIMRPLPGNPDLGKVNILVSDPSVESIECQGPNKNIFVRKNGAIQRTSINLAKEEITEIINEFSERTKIPIVGGSLKAAYGNLIITAAISEFVGSRFIIQKKNPFLSVFNF